jgi:hypothetical protein
MNDLGLRRGAAKTMNGLAMVCAMVAVALVVLGVALLAGQVIDWLKVGTWRPTTVFDASKRLMPNKVRIWIDQPDDWIGLWKILNGVLSWSAWWVSIVLAVPFVYWSERLSRQTKTTSQGTT